MSVVVHSSAQRQAPPQRIRRRLYFLTNIPQPAKRHEPYGNPCRSQLRRGLRYFSLVDEATLICTRVARAAAW